MRVSISFQNPEDQGTVVDIFKQVGLNDPECTVVDKNIALYGDLDRGGLGQLEILVDGVNAQIDQNTNTFIVSHE